MKRRVTQLVIKETQIKVKKGCHFTAINVIKIEWQTLRKHVKPSEISYAPNKDKNMM